MEPINYNSGGILPASGYLEAVRKSTSRHGVVLIFDEILSGFRTGASCAQGHLGVTPDLCTLGKCLGGGTPLSAFAGRAEIMEACAPIGKGVHSGTYNAHPIPILAADAFLDVVASPAFWDDMRGKEDLFYPGLREAFARAGVPVWVQATGARFNLLFGLEAEPRTYREAARCNRATEIDFYRAVSRAASISTTRGTTGSPRCTAGRSWRRPSTRSRTPHEQSLAGRDARVVQPSGSKVTERRDRASVVR